MTRTTTEHPAAAFADTKPHYDILDGLRGVAAPARHLVPPLRGIRHEPPRPAVQPWLSGRRLLLPALGLRHRLCLRRPLAGAHDARGVFQAAPHPVASDGRAGGRAGGRRLLPAGERAVGRHAGRLSDGAGGHAAGHAAAPGGTRRGRRGARQRRDVSAQRSELVALLRIHRQHPLCARAAAALDARPRGARRPYGSGSRRLRRGRPLGLRAPRRGVVARRP